MIKKLIRKGLAKIGIQIQRANTIPLGKSNPIHQWDDDKYFIKIMDQISDYTLVDRVRCFMIYQFAKQIVNVPGDVAEIGVYKGGTARLLSKALDSTNKIIHLCDTFAGMPPTDPTKDLHKEGDFNDTSIDAVKFYLNDCSNVVYHIGVFTDTITGIENNLFSLVHIDVDIYKSVLNCLTFFYHRVRTGGIIIIDDYGFLSCPGAKMAVDEFFLDKIEYPCYLPTGQCVIIRL
jgi:O-methyltransferase